MRTRHSAAAIGILAMGAVVLSAIFLAHRAPPPVAQSWPRVRWNSKDRPERIEMTINGGSPVGVAAGCTGESLRIEPSLPDPLPEDLRTTLPWATRKEMVREIYWKFRSAVACGDERAKEELDPALRAEPKLAWECAQEEVAFAPTRLDRELGEKARDALRVRLLQDEN